MTEPSGPALATYCRACGKSIDPRAVICPGCGVPQTGSVPFGAAVAQAPNRVAQQVATEAADAPLAGWWIRAGAIVIDSLILLLPFWIIAAICGPILGYLIDLGLWFAYYLLMVRDAQNGQSLGMQAVGIRIRREDGQPVSVQTVTIRQFLLQGILFGTFGLALVIPYLLNYLWPLWDKENRALHDMVAKTRVVRV